MMRPLCIAKTADDKACQRYQKYGELCGTHKPKDVPIKIQEALILTFADVCDHDLESAKVGKPAEQGLTLEDLIRAQKQFENLGAFCELTDLGNFLPRNYKEKVPFKYETGHILVIRNGINFLLKDINKTDADLMQEQKNLNWDTTAVSRKHRTTKTEGIVTKSNNWSLCFADEPKVQNLKANEGTVVAFNDVPCTNHVRNKLVELMGSTVKDIVGEGRFYFDLYKCNTKHHGEINKKILICARFGAQFPLHFQWFVKWKAVGSPAKFMLNPGDMYILTNKAIGNDWRKATILTLRHGFAAEEKWLVIDIKQQTTAKLL